MHPQAEPKPSEKKSSPLIKLAITLVCIAAIISAFLAFAPKGLDLDLSKIGNGKPSLVFVYDANLAVSIEQAAIINTVRSSTTKELNFLIAKIGRPDAKALVKQYSIASVGFVLFDSKGQALKVHQGFLPEADIHTLLKALD